MHKILKTLEEKLKAEHYDANLFFDNCSGTLPPSGTQVLAIEWLNAVENAIDKFYALAKQVGYIDEIKKEIIGP